MPLIKIFYQKPLDRKNITIINAIIHKALEEHFKVPKDDVFQFWIPTDRESNFINEKYLLIEGKRDSNLLYLEIFCAPGRSNNQKKRLYQEIAQEINTKTSVVSQDVFILLNEVSLENWSFGEGKAQMIDIEKVEDTDKDEK